MRKILFHHIPKMAGTSLVSAASVYFGDRTCPARYDFQLSDEMIRDDRLVFYHGHFSQDVVRRFRHLSPDAFIFTLLRHPFTRTLSQYYNWTDRGRVRSELAVVAGQADPSEHVRQLRQKFEDKIFGMSLEEFLASEDSDINQVVNNTQCQYLTDFEQPEYLRFNRACHNAVTRYDFIGLKELYGPCLRLIEARCALNAYALSDLRSNDNDHVKFDGRYRVTASELALLERRSVYDLALFYACHAMLLKDHAADLPAEAQVFDAAVDLPLLLG